MRHLVSRDAQRSAWCNSGISAQATPSAPLRVAANQETVRPRSGELKSAGEDARPPQAFSSLPRTSTIYHAPTALYRHSLRRCQPPDLDCLRLRQASGNARKSQNPRAHAAPARTGRGMARRPAGPDTLSPQAAEIQIYGGVRRHRGIAYRGVDCVDRDQSVNSELSGIGCASVGLAISFGAATSFVSVMMLS